MTAINRRLAAAIAEQGIPLTADLVETVVKCRCDEPGADPYSCEADDCTTEFSELNSFGSARPVNVPGIEVSRTCRCGWTTAWHVDDGSAEEELHHHIARAHGPEAAS